VVSGNDHVQRRIVVEYGQLYAYCYMTDGNGKILEQELWKQSYMLDAKDANEEAHEAFQAVYQHIQDTVVFPNNSAEDSNLE
jgi:hypothetical protein